MMGSREAAFAFAGLLLLAVLPGPIPAQQVRAAVVADTVRVGDVVPVAVRLTVEPGHRVVFPDTLPLGDDRLENAARVRERLDTLEDGRTEATAVYSVTPWRVGELPLPALEIPVVAGSERVRTVTASLPGLDVLSVLPEDTAGIELKPAKGVIGRSWSWWPIVLALLAVLAIVLAVLWWRRRRGREAPAVAALAISPRERALGRLQEAREAGLVESGAMKEFYTRVSEAVREYAAALESGWSEDLTTSELLSRVRQQAGPSAAAGLASLLRPADQVKFARRLPDRETALAEWEATRRWVLEFRWPPPQESGDREVAA